MPPRHQAPQPAQPLTTLQYALCALGVPVCLAMFAVGVAGLLILMDVEGQKPLSQSEFAKHWRWLIGKNTFFQPFTVNFGAIGLIFCITKLVGHHRQLATVNKDKEQ